MVRRVASQRGAVVRGAIVATALVAAVALQLAGPRLQCRLADLVGITERRPGASADGAGMTPSCGSPSGAIPDASVQGRHRGRAGSAPVI